MLLINFVRFSTLNLFAVIVAVTIKYLSSHAISINAIKTTTNSTLTSSVPRSMLSKADLDTLSSASAGHSVNQSMEQQLTREGNIRQRDLRALPTGLMQSTMCRLFLLHKQFRKQIQGGVYLKLI